MKYASIIYFLARRLIFNRNNNYSIKLVAWICSSAIVIGSLALTLIFAIMQGFEATTAEQLQSIHPQLILQSPIDEHLNFKKIGTILAENCNVATFAPYTLTYGVLYNPKYTDKIDFHNISLIKGIDPNVENSVSKVATKIITPIAFTQALSQNQVIIGATLAKNLNLAVHSVAEIFIPTESNAKKKSVIFQKISVSIGGIIKTGISEFDDNLIIVSLDFAKNHFTDYGICAIGIKLQPQATESLVIQELRRSFGGLNIFSWKELYAPIVTALKLEKYTAIAIAILIIIIASMTLIALLFMLITRHINTIVILKTLGLSQNKIYQTFIMIGLIITTSSSCLGMAIAAVVGTLIKKYHFIELPEAYYLSTLPIELSTSIFLFVFVATTIIALIAIQLPLKLITKLNLAQLIKDE